MKIGDVVMVGPAYKMAAAPPFCGRGTFEADRWTGQRYRVVGFIGSDARLADATLLNVDESDEVVSIHTRRLTVVA